MKPFILTLGLMFSASSSVFACGPLIEYVCDKLSPGDARGMKYTFSIGGGSGSMEQCLPPQFWMSNLNDPQKTRSIEFSLYDEKSKKYTSDNGDFLIAGRISFGGGRDLLELKEKSSKRIIRFRCENKYP